MTLLNYFQMYIVEMNCSVFFPPKCFLCEQILFNWQPINAQAFFIWILKITVVTNSACVK
jgi:hypothetical protein